MFQLIGEVKVPNLGVEILVAAADPQGFNPEILMLDLHLVQRSGAWPMQEVWKQAVYRRPIGAAGYTNADILCDGRSVAFVEVPNLQ